MSIFLDAEELYELTGRRTKSKQIEQLRNQRIAFRVNATGHPVVTRAAVEGQKAAPLPPPAWSPRVMKAA